MRRRAVISIARMKGFALVSMICFASCGGSNSGDNSRLDESRLVESGKVLGVESSAENKVVELESARVGESEGIVVSLSGKAQRTREGISSIVKVSDKVALKDSFSVDLGGILEIDFPAIGNIKIRGIARFSLASIDTDGAGATIALDSGSIACKIKKLTRADGFVVKSQTAAVGVRGTSFLVRVEASGKVSIGLKEGSLAIYPRLYVDSSLYDPMNKAGSPLPSSAFPLLKPGQAISIDASELERVTKAVENLEKGVTASGDPIGQFKKGFKPTALPAKDAEEIMSVRDPDQGIASRVGELSSKIGNENLPVATPQDAISLLASPDTFTAIQPDYVLTQGAVLENATIAQGSTWVFSGFYGAKPGSAFSFPLKASEWSFSPEGAKDSFSGSIASVGAGKEQKEMLAKTAYSLKKGGVYTVEFSARSTLPRVVEANILGSGGERYAPSYPISAGSDGLHYQFNFVMTAEDDSQAKLCFFIEAGDSSILISDARISAPSVRIVYDAKTNLVYNDDFSRGLVAWYSDPPGASGFSAQDGILKYEAPSLDAGNAKGRGGDALLSLRLSNAYPFTLKKGKRYVLEFDAWAKESFDIGLWIGGTKLNHARTDLGGIPLIAVGTKPTRYSISFLMRDDDSVARLSLLLGIVKGELAIDNLRLREERK